MESVTDRFRTRLLPALLLASGVTLLTSGLLSYTTAVELAPETQAPESYRPLPTIDPGIVLPSGGGGPLIEPTISPDRVPTRVVIPRLRIDMAVIAQPPTADYPLCDVALYFTDLGPPGSDRATYIYAHAQPKMFLPLLQASKDHNGQKLIGATVQLYTSDNMLFLYRVAEVRRHSHSIDAVYADTSGRLWLQTSEGPRDADPKLQVVADLVSSSPADPDEAHPAIHARECHRI